MTRDGIPKLMEMRSIEAWLGIAGVVGVFEDFTLDMLLVGLFAVLVLQDQQRKQSHMLVTDGCSA